MTELFISEPGWKLVKFDGFERCRQSRHPGESRGPDTNPEEAANKTKSTWIPALTGMTTNANSDFL
jgi:hypothetical protein